MIGKDAAVFKWNFENGTEIISFHEKDKFLARLQESSACLEAMEGKSSPSRKRFALGSG